MPHQTLTVAEVLTSPHARSYRFFLDQPVDEALIHEAYDLAKVGPSAFNGNPLRIVLVKSPEARAKLAQTTMGPNTQHMLDAPVVALLAFDTDFWKRLHELSPHFDGGYKFYENNPQLVPEAAQTNATLQAAYFVLALRSVGLDSCIATGFDINKATELLLAPTQPTWKSLMYICIGRGDEARNWPRDPRPSFESVCLEM